MLTFLACYFLHNSADESLDNYIKIISTIITLATLIYTAINVNLILGEGQNRTLFQKKEFATRLITEYNNPEMGKLSILSYKLKKSIENISPNEVQALLDNDKEATLAIVTMLNFYEKLAISIEHGLGDEELLKDFFKGIILHTFNILKDYIIHVRKLRNNMKIFIKFETLAVRWSK